VPVIADEPACDDVKPKPCWGDHAPDQALTAATSRRSAMSSFGRARGPRCLLGLTAPTAPARTTLLESMRPLRWNPQVLWRGRPLPGRNGAGEAIFYLPAASGPMAIQVVEEVMARSRRHHIGARRRKGFPMWWQRRTGASVLKRVFHRCPKAKSPFDHSRSGS